MIPSLLYASFMLCNHIISCLISSKLCQPPNQTSHQPKFSQGIPPCKILSLSSLLHIRKLRPWTIKLPSSRRFFHFFYVRWPDSFYPCLTRTIRSLSATYHQKITPLNQNLIQYALIIHDINAHSSNLIAIHHIVYTHIVETSTESSYLRFFKVSVWAPRFFPPLINYIHQISIQSNLRCVYNVHNASRSPRIFAEQNELIAASLHFR